MKEVLIVDTETTGVDPASDKLIELGWARWNVEHRCLAACGSYVIPGAQNKAAAVNGIDDAFLQGQYLGPVPPAPDSEIRFVLAHNAEFDKAFVASADDVVPDFLREAEWICTQEDMTWPRAARGESLVNTALKHGVSVVSAHRAIHDVLMLVRLLEAVPDVDARLAAALAHSRLPKCLVVSLAPFEQKDTVKAHGFKWDPDRRAWFRRMAIQDAEKLPFRWKMVQAEAQAS